MDQQLSVSRTGEFSAARSAPPRPELPRPALPHPVPRPLPAWPLLTLIWGYPLMWVLGLSQFAPTVMSLIMLLLLLMRGQTRAPALFWIWGALLLWMVGSTLMLRSVTDLIGWGMRFSIILNAGVCALYYLNAHEKISPDAVLRALSGLWSVCVLLGCCSLLAPDLRLVTPMSLIMPDSLLSNELVRDYVSPRLTETQQPWGAPEPYIRPSAPFVYANSWGLAFALLTPVVIARLLRGAGSRARSWYAVLGLLSIIPALASSNRGMFLGLGVAALSVWCRALARGRWLSVVGGALGFSVLLAGFIGSGAVASVLSRQEYSDSTGGRSALYRATLHRVADSPLLGFGTTEMEPSIGVSLGTQGQLWLLLFCYGFVGASLFIVFLGSAVLRSSRHLKASGLWLHAVLISASLMFIVYSFDTLQMITLLLVIALIERSRAEGLRL